MKLLAPIALLAIILSGPAQAAVATDDATRVVVKLSDLDLTHASGRAVLRQRVASGVAAFCGPLPKLSNLDGSHAYRTCVRDATEQTMTAVNQAIVAQTRQPVALASAK
jgi:UrcA family protein